MQWGKGNDKDARESLLCPPLRLAHRPTTPIALPSQGSQKAYMKNMLSLGSHSLPSSMAVLGERPGF